VTLRRWTVTRLNTQALINTRFEACPTVWALTTGRSGSTTLARAFDSLPGVDAVHEAYPNLLYEGRLAYEKKGLKRAAAVRLLYLARATLVEGSYDRQGMFMDLSPFLTFLAEDLAFAFRSSKFLHLHRDPRTFVPSALAKGWWSKGQNEHLYADVGGKEPWQKAIRFWAVTHREALRLENILPTYRLAAERLWSDGRAFEELLAWLGQDEAKAKQARGVGEGVNRAKNKRPWDEAWEQYLRKVAGDVVEELGYAQG